MPTTESRSNSHRARRTWVAVGAVAVIAVGLATHLLGSGPAADLLGDALYATMIYLLVAFVSPRMRIPAVGTVALLICTLIEVFQLTGLPAAWAASFWPVRLVLGVGFDALDLVAYAVGAAAASAVDLAFRRRPRAARAEHGTTRLPRHGP